MASSALQAATAGVAFQRESGVSGCRPASVKVPISCSTMVRRSISVAKNSMRVTAAVATGEGSTAQFAKEMERVSAKEALLFAIKDAGGINALTAGNGNAAGWIDVSEKVLALERLNPTPRPTSSPLLEGAWEFVWASARSPALQAAKVLIKRFPKEVASLDSLILEILQGGAEATASLKLLSSVETTFTLTTRLVAEGPLRLREEYVSGVLALPVASEGPLKGAYDAFLSAAASLPESFKEALAGGLRLPLTGYFERQLLISYLDDEMLVSRDQTGVVDVLLRAMLPTIGAEVDTVAVLEEYES